MTSPTPKKKNFSWMPSNPKLRALMQSCVGILAINWIFQGMRGMQSKELSFRLALEWCIAILIWPMFALGMPTWIALCVALFFAHSFNWAFNGHIWVCVRYCQFYRRTPEALSRFLARLKEEISADPGIREAVCIGSIGDKGDVGSERSDIDLRIIFGTGWRNWLYLNFWLAYWRTLALISIVPLDVYIYDSPEALQRFRQDEGLLVLKDEEGRVAALFGGRIHPASEAN